MNETVTRRFMSLTLGSLFGASANAQTVRPGTTIHQEVEFKATPERIYAALLDSGQFSDFTGDTARIQPQPGGAFKLFGGRIEGRNIELVPGRRIVQAWRPSYWPAGVYSIVGFELTPRSSGTLIVFDHAGFTADKWQDLNDGWTQKYWDALHKYLKA
jgi:uncharacterized protein YndB with AHSA1/START domain